MYTEEDIPRRAAAKEFRAGLWKSFTDDGHCRESLVEPEGRQGDGSKLVATSSGRREPVGANWSRGGALIAVVSVVVRRAGGLWLSGQIGKAASDGRVIKRGGRG
ncbi:hypothetical protein Droror1_Dr00021657 [Drosera rotundifolia]